MNKTHWINQSGRLDPFFGGYNVGVAPSQDASDHQDYYIFSRGFQPKPAFPTVTGRGPQWLVGCRVCSHVLFGQEPSIESSIGKDLQNHGTWHEHFVNRMLDFPFKQRRNHETTNEHVFISRTKSTQLTICWKQIMVSTQPNHNVSIGLNGTIHVLFLP